jgi:hypothetical protein
MDSVRRHFVKTPPRIPVEGYQHFGGAHHIRRQSSSKTLITTCRTSRRRNPQVHDRYLHRLERQNLKWIQFMVLTHNGAHTGLAIHPRESRSQLNRFWLHFALSAFTKVNKLKLSRYTPRNCLGGEEV